MKLPQGTPLRDYARDVGALFDERHGEHDVQAEFSEILQVNPGGAYFSLGIKGRELLNCSANQFRSDAGRSQCR